MSEEEQIAGIIVNEADGDEVSSVIVDQVAGVIINDAVGEPEPA